MSVPVVREGSQVSYRPPHHPRKPEKRGGPGRLIVSLLVLVVLSTVAFGAVRMLSAINPWRNAAASDINTGVPPVATKPSTGNGGGQAPIGQTTPPVTNAGSGGTAQTTPAASLPPAKDAGPDPASKPSTGAGTGQATPPVSTPVVVGIKTLVNRTHPLPATYVPQLVKVNARMADGVTPDEKMMQPEAAKAIESLMQAAEKENVIFYCVSGYRSYATQKWLYEYRVNTEGQAMADLYTARPGQSEHQTGLAMDLANGLSGDLSDAFGDTAEGKWLVKNAPKFGFIIRYPLGKEKLTGYNYEPWHLRYVGVETATAIASKGIVLEEYAN